MSQISKCPKLRVVLGYWEALGEVSELRYKNLLYSSSKRSYCIVVTSARDGSTYYATEAGKCSHYEQRDDLVDGSLVENTHVLCRR